MSIKFCSLCSAAEPPRLRSPQCCRPLVAVRHLLLSSVSSSGGGGGASHAAPEEPQGAPTATDARERLGMVADRLAAAAAKDPGGGKGPPRPADVKPHQGTISEGFTAGAAVVGSKGRGAEDLLSAISACSARAAAASGRRKRTPPELRDLAAQAVSRAAELSPDDIASLCVAFARLGFFDTSFKGAMADQVIRRAHDFPPEASKHHYYYRVTVTVVARFIGQTLLTATSKR